MLAPSVYPTHHFLAIPCFNCWWLKNLHLLHSKGNQLNVVLYLLQSSLKAYVSFLCLPPKLSFKKYCYSLNKNMNCGIWQRACHQKHEAKESLLSWNLPLIILQWRTAVVKLVVESCWGKRLCVALKGCGIFGGAPVAQGISNILPVETSSDISSIDLLQYTYKTKLCANWCELLDLG